jgi:methionine-rich copper-binding protein CopC
MSKTRFIIVFIVSFVFVRVAEAHAFLDHADPKVGSTLHDPPSEVKVWMTENLEAAFSRLQVFDAKGVEVDKRDIRINGATMVVSLQKLSAGTYHVSWQAIATDTHKTSGTFDFTIQ